ncbi:SDR family NAD(P)-dependent oxidoreductase [Rhizobium rhizogenes]|uniref:SDR family NAD(P)-dependent oxidoreductase n=1 Tax=Rhizobium rhizogenes TaxID=359 RepID=UPI00080FEC49|nr:glucose 1-dehydrogenase [Rhizobium rhizogenes]OCJ10713.1 oxidoreductase [Agrobacterium sp. B131/95]NTF90221.1 SDR family oxidoreductase [Rhizobium rhizogenes]NTI38084.1 SDR family oxidoreductase [Rhizobium rhizogenes]NTI45038.1 SDR family oxidoreductase [Rhizobium rhizogenes]WEO69516.1 SDR family oxidoreductase [Rhizobium rhizogenes]
MVDFSEDFKGKRVVVTGAAGIFGGWIAQAFANAGAHVLLTDKDPARLGAATESLAGSGHLEFAADLTSDTDIKALLAYIAENWGAADVLVNNAGIYPSGFLLDINADDWDKIFGINLRAPFLVSQGVARQMIDQGVKGSIINISSGAARKMRRSVVPYCVSKTALDRLNKGLAIELAEFGIRVNIVEPGFAPGSEVSHLTQEHIDSVLGNIPLGRPSQPTDAANAVLFLASDAAAYITGSTLAADGGNSIGSLAVYQAKKKPL